MPFVEHTSVLLLAPVAGLAGWWLATRGRRGRRLRGLGAAASATLLAAALAGLLAAESSALRVFVLDVSSSTRGTTAALLPEVRATAARVDAKRRVAVVAFGRDAAIILPPTSPAELPAELPLVTGPDHNGTSIERGLATALALFPQGAPGDIVLVTDGRENGGDAIGLATQLGAARRPVHSLTLLSSIDADAWVEAVRVPPFVQAGQPIDFEVLVGATEPMQGKLILLLNGRDLARPETVDVMARRTVFARRVSPQEPGLYTLTARLLCPGDKTSENDESAAAVRVTGRLNALLVSASPERRLGAVLAASGAMQVRRISAEALAPTNEEMLRCDVVVLDDVSAAVLGPERTAWLGRFVKDAGGGLVVFGGRDSFGPGSYTRTPLADLLPVDPDPERRAARPSSVVIVADRSGSMAEMLEGRQKIDFVREALLRAGMEFGTVPGSRSDELSVVAFNQQPEVLLERRPVGTPSGAAELRGAVARIFPSGRTQIGAALDAARAILRKAFVRRYMILVSDGEGQDSLDGAAIARAMKADAIELSVLGTGAAMNDGLTALKQAADATGGRFVMLRSISELPAAMARETRTIAGSLVREHEGGFEVARGPGLWLGEVPVPSPVKGYVLTGARNEAPPLLVAGSAPILAAWRRGVGRVVACTTSPEDWASEWATAAPDFLRSIVLWAGASERQEQVTIRLEPEDGCVRILVQAAVPLGDRQLVASVFPPEGRAASCELRRIGRLRYEGISEVRERGTYVVKVAEPGAGAVLGEGHATFGYSAEWRPGGDTTVAKRLSALTGGVVLGSLADLPLLAPAEAGAGTGARRNLAWVLIFAAAAVFLVSSMK